jgi:hypothetical protein
MSSTTEEHLHNQEILDSPVAKIRGEISILQHNVGKQREAHYTLLEIAFKRGIDLVLVQEPAV